MAEAIVSEFMRERHARMRAEERSLGEFVRDLHRLRKAADALNRTGTAMLDAFDLPQRELAERLALTAAERRIAFERHVGTVPQRVPDGESDGDANTQGHDTGQSDRTAADGTPWPHQ